MAAALQPLLEKLGDKFEVHNGGIRGYTNTIEAAKNALNLYEHEYTCHFVSSQGIAIGKAGSSGKFFVTFFKEI